jgi:UPF0716 family protein affecting phage T7 exclusion
MEANSTQLVLGIALQLLVTWALTAWGAWVARRQGNTRFWRFASYTPWLSLGFLLVGTIIGVTLLSRAFEATKTVDPAHKAARLAEGISSAMNASALFMIPGYALLLFGIVSFAVGSLRKPA